MYLMLCQHRKPSARPRAGRRPQPTVRFKVSVIVTLNLGLRIDGLLLDTVHIIDIIGPGEEIEDCRTPNAVDLGQIQVIANAPDDLGLAQHMAVMLCVLQAMDIRLDFHN
jgi:hypothetical protein